MGDDLETVFSCSVSELFASVQKRADVKVTFKTFGRVFDLNLRGFVLIC